MAVVPTHETVRVSEGDEPNVRVIRTASKRSPSPRVPPGRLAARLDGPGSRPQLELDEGVETATLVTRQIDAVNGDLDRLLQLSSRLIRQGVAVRLELREDASIAHA